MTKKARRLRVSALNGTGIVSGKGSFRYVTASNAIARVEAASVKIVGPPAASARLNAPQKDNSAQMLKSLIRCLNERRERHFLIFKPLSLASYYERTR